MAVLSRTSTVAKHKRHVLLERERRNVVSCSELTYGLPVRGGRNMNFLSCSANVIHLSNSREVKSSLYFDLANIFMTYTKFK